MNPRENTRWICNLSLNDKKSILLNLNLKVNEIGCDLSLLDKTETGTNKKLVGSPYMFVEFYDFLFFVGFMVFCGCVCGV